MMGTKGAYIHNFHEMAETSPQAISQTFQAGGIGQVRFKTHQWLSWNGTPKSAGYDHSPYAITGLGAVRDRVDDFLGQGIEPYPWCVPMGLDIEREADMAANVAKIAGRIDFDVEPYAEFWPGLPQGDYSAVAPFFKRVRELLGDTAEITLDIPARNHPWEWGVLKEAVRLALPYVNRIALQSYFGLEQAKEAEARVRAFVQLHGRTLPVDHIVVPDMLGQDLGGYLSQHQADRLLIWLARDMSPDAYTRLEQITLSDAPAPAPGPVGHQWQDPGGGGGFAGLRQVVGERMGDPTSDAYPDSQGNVWQDGVHGRAIWVNNMNRNFWLDRDFDPTVL